MQDFILTLLFNIHGIGAASGLAYQDGHLLLISDNSNCLYKYQIAESKLLKLGLQPGKISENIPKPLKPDYESLAIVNDKIYLFGSGSMPNRNVLAITSTDKAETSIHDLTKLYSAMREKSGISTDDFNIEGATMVNNKWYFFQRGNGPAGMNGVFTVEGNITSDNFQIAYHNIPLPNCNGIPATFTDAVSVDGKIYFIATAENSNSVYHDGEILGSIVGQLDPNSMSVEFTRQISTTHKFEGIAFFKKTATDLTFLLCEDNDTEVSNSGIYELRVATK